MDRYNSPGFTVIALLTILTGGCTQPNPESLELALNSGTRVEATAGPSKLTIIAGRGIDRRYEWGGCGLNASMSPRSSRWMGSMGIYDPAGRLFELPFLGCHGITRTVAEEGQLHFASEEAASAWLNRYRKSYTSTVWTSDGFVVAWDVDPERVQLGVSVYQLCIHGQRPAHLAGATDAAIQITNSSGDGTARRECVKVSHSVETETQKAWSDWWHELDSWPKQSNN